jgi:class 3 adenylate cyclase
VSIPPVERKLAAICAADIAGCRRLMAHDEVGTLARLKACRLIIDGLIATHRGRIFDTPRGSVAADFASAVDAVTWAVAVQNAITTRNPAVPGALVHRCGRADDVLRRVPAGSQPARRRHHSNPQRREPGRHPVLSSEAGSSSSSR